MTLLVSLPPAVQRRVGPYLDRIAMVEHLPVMTCRDVSTVLGVPLNAIAKGVLWEAGRGGTTFHLLTVVPASERVSRDRVRAVAGAVRLSLAANAERVTGFAPGTIPPFALPSDVVVLLDEALATQGRVWFGSGLPTVSLVAAGEVLVALAGAEIAQLTDRQPA